MEIITAKSAGFCFGVKRAVNLVYEETGRVKSGVYTLGPIIHNEQVVADLSAKGVRIMDENLYCEEEGRIPPEGSTVIIRSHGISRSLTEELLAHKYRIVDATCPFVAKIHDIVRDMSREGHPVVIIGNPDHPEVVGIRGWAEGDCAVVETAEDTKSLRFPMTETLCIVSQTTFNHSKFQELVEIIDNLGYHINVTNTICGATRERQTEALELAEQSDIMIVIGGKSSSNTQKLRDICKSRCSETYYIQKPEDLARVHFPTDCRVGITAGASTPNSIIQEVSQYVRRTEL